MAAIVKQRTPTAELRKLQIYQSKAMRGLGRMEERERGRNTKRIPYREGVRIDIDRARLVTESYKETEGEPTITRRAKALAHVMDNMKIYILPHELIVGNIASRPGSIVTFPELWWRWLDKAIDNEYHGMMVDDAERDALHQIHQYWRNKAVHGMERDYLPEHVKPYWSYTDQGVFMWIHGGHVGTPNYEKIFRVGINGLLAEARQRLSALLNDPDEALLHTRDFVEKKRFWGAAIISLEALARFGKRFADLAKGLAVHEQDEVRRADLEEIARTCEWVPANGPRSFREAVQCYWFVNLWARILDLQSSGYGDRLDVIFWPFYCRDVKNGQITRAKAQELIEHVMLKANEEGALVHPAQGGGGAPLITRVSTIGGVDSEGNDITNELTYIVMDAKNKIGLIQPAIAIRLHRHTPHELYVKIAQSLALQPGVYSFFNDEMMIPYLMRLGISLRDARCYATDGCMRWIIPGKPLAQRALGGRFALPKCLEYALFQGVDKQSGRQVGLATPDSASFTSLEDVIQAFLEQVRFFAAKLFTIYNITDVLDEELLPQPLLSSMLDGCMENGQDCRKHKLIANTIFMPVGQTTVANSLAAIAKLVFEEREVSLPELVAALKTNWEGKEDLHQLCLNAPKFGNDDDFVDSIAADIHLRITQTFESFKNIWGGPFMQDGSGGASYYSTSGLTGATPDGRKDRDLFNDGTISPTLGTDCKGPTAVLRSVGKVDHVNTFTQLFNQKFLPQFLKGKYQEVFSAYLRSFVDMGIHQIQFNVIERETLLDAQAHPENYGDLVVRVAGYNAFFVDMEKRIQDQIIARTSLVLD